VAGGRDQLERADAVAWPQQARGLDVDGRIAAAQLRVGLAGIEAHVAAKEASVAIGYQDLGLRQLGVQRRERTGVVPVGVRECDPLDRSACSLGRREDVTRGAGQAGVDESEAVVLAHQVAVDRA
jgi:hypothetical protein